MLFYHSNAEPSGIAGLATIHKTAAPDPTQFDKKSEYFDPKASKENPRWHAVTVAFQEKFPRVIPLEEMKSRPELNEMLVIRKGQRLSIQPVTKKEFDCIKAMAYR